MSLTHTFGPADGRAASPADFGISQILPLAAASLVEAQSVLEKALALQVLQGVHL
jgi:hypothetical protein